MQSTKKERLTICLDKSLKVAIKTEALIRGINASTLILQCIEKELASNASKKA
jgi:predicted DNA binding CopG/RHH family protein